MCGVVYCIRTHREHVQHSVPLKLLLLGDSINAEAACFATTNSIYLSLFSKMILNCAVHLPLFFRHFHVPHSFSLTSFRFWIFSNCLPFRILSVCVREFSQFFFPDYWTKIVQTVGFFLVQLFSRQWNISSKSLWCMKGQLESGKRTKICDKFAVDGLKWFADINQCTVSALDFWAKVAETLSKAS